MIHHSSATAADIKQTVKIVLMIDEIFNSMVASQSNN